MAVAPPPLAVKPRLYLLHQSQQPRRVFLEVLEATRVRFKLRIYAYVVMPEHVHLLLSEPDVATLANAIHFLKLSSSKRIHRLSGAEGAFWQKRYYDFNVHGERKRIEKLRLRSPQPGQTRTLRQARGVAVEQLPTLRNRGRGSY